MKPDPSHSPPREVDTAGSPPTALWPADWVASLLGDFPNPVLLTGSHKEVVFMNRPAQELLSHLLQPGDPCPICNQLSGWLVREAGRFWPRECLQTGGTLNRLPIHIRNAAGALVSYTVTASPIQSPDDQPAGCLLMLRNLHEDVQAHPAVQLQLATLASMLENFPTPFFMVDPDLVITHVNARMEKLTGYSREEIVGKVTCDTVLNTQQCNTEDCVLKQVMRDKTPVSGIRRVVRDRQGNEIPVVVYASLITDPTGKVIGGFEAIRDITPRIEAEKKVELISELTQEGILMVDNSLEVLFINSRMSEILDKPKEELVGQDLEQVLTFQHKKMAADLLGEGHWRGSHFITTLDPVVRGGDRRVFETWMAASKIGKNNFVYVFLRDLTQRIRIGRELQRAHNFLQEIIRCCVDGIVVVDNNGVPLIFNEGAERLLGYKAEEIIGHPEMLFKFYPPNLAREMKRRMLSEENGPRDKLRSTRIFFINKAGEEIPVTFSGAIVRISGKEVASVGIFSDLRETLKIQKKLEESQTQLIQAEKIASLGRLAAGVAHEINNPLAGILIYTELLGQQMAENDENRQYIQEIIDQTLRCRQIVTRLLEFSRQSLGQKTLFDVNQVINRCVQLLSHQATFHNVKIDLELDPELPQILGDVVELQQVFTNLLINAADAMQGTGLITVTSHKASAGNSITLSFADTGSGIPAEIRDKIFEPFFSTKPVGKGTGLGLFIVFGVIQRHGGSIQVDSAPGGGTIFTITLPLDYQPEMAQFVQT